MTTSPLPQASVETPMTDAAILAVWRGQKMDTRDLASRFSVSEAYVYNLIARGKWAVPQAAKIPYAGKQR